MNGADPTQALRDIHMAPAPSWWPPAPGWWLVAVLALVLLLILLRFLAGRMRVWRRRRRALQLLANARTVSDDRRQVLAELSIALKRIALQCFPQQSVAGLNGADWLAFLDRTDRTGGERRFRDGPGRVLADAPYRPSVEVDLDAVFALARDWTRRNV
jgi:hypothetical protein